MAAVRGEGIAAAEHALAVVLETDGSFTVIGSAAVPATVLRSVRGYRSEDRGPEG